MNALSRSSSESRYLTSKHCQLVLRRKGTSRTCLEGSSANRALISVFFCTILSNLMICRRSSCTVGRPEPCRIISTQYDTSIREDIPYHPLLQQTYPEFAKWEVRQHHTAPIKTLEYSPPASDSSHHQKTSPPHPPHQPQTSHPHPFHHPHHPPPSLSPSNPSSRSPPRHS